MPGEGNEGRFIPGGHQEFGPGELEELRGLKRKQIEGPYTEVDRLRLLELQKLQEVAGSASKPLSQEERAEYFRLTKDQISDHEWTPEKASRVVELQRRIDGERQRGS